MFLRISVIRRKIGETKVTVNLLFVEVKNNVLFNLLYIYILTIIFNDVVDKATNLTGLRAYLHVGFSLVGFDCI